MGGGKIEVDQSFMKRRIKENMIQFIKPHRAATVTIDTRLLLWLDTSELPSGQCNRVLTLTG